MFTKLGTLKLSDFWRGLIIAILTAPLTIIYQSIQAGSLDFDWKTILLVGVAGAISYLLKNLGTGSNGNILSNK
jgi:hypothetical protein